MARVEVIMPQMGESIAEGTVVRWLKGVGDVVERDENLLEIATDKVDAEIPSPASGRVAAILVEPQKTVDIGTVVAVIETDSSVSLSGTPVAAAPPIAVAPPTAVARPVAVAAPVASSTSTMVTVDVIMPQMGESIVEGTIVRWLKAVGDTIERDENLLEIATDKVDAEIPSPATGTVVDLLAAPQETVDVGKVIARIATGEVAVASAPSAPTPAAPSGNGMTSAAPAAQSSALVASVAASNYTDTRPTPAHSASDLRKLRSTPLVRKIASEHNIDLRQLQGSGLSGRVTRKDIEAFLAAGGATTAPALTAALSAALAQPARPQSAALAPVAAPVQVAPVAAPAKAPAVKIFEGDRVEDMSRMRISIGKHMTESRRTSPHANTVHEIDFSEVFKARAKLRDQFAARGVKLTYTAFIAQACIKALVKYPIVNSSISGKQIIYRGEINLGIAVALEDGLIVPVIRNADELNLLGIARAINDLAARARSRRLKPEEITRGTFTLTNPGAFGSLYGIPIINQPQVGILGCGGIKKRLTVSDDDQISIRPMSIFCMSFDHRVIDGAIADHFMVAVKDALANPTE